MFALGVTMYGQMTAGSYCYIGPQGIVHGTTLTVLNAGRKYLGVESLESKIFITSGLGGMSGAQVASLYCVLKTGGGGYPEHVRIYGKSEFLVFGHRFLACIGIHFQGLNHQLFLTVSWDLLFGHAFMTVKHRFSRHHRTDLVEKYNDTLWSLSSTKARFSRKVCGDRFFFTKIDTPQYHFNGWKLPNCKRLTLAMLIGPGVKHDHGS